MNRFVHIFAICWLWAVGALWAQDYGLDSRPSFSAFHGDRLPPNAATVSGDWSTVIAFPSLTFLNPMGVLPMPGTNQLVVWEREGRVYSFENDSSVSSKTLILDIHNRVQGWDDSGLMGMAFHPQFATNRYVFLYYTYVAPNKVQGDMNNRPPTFGPSRDRLVRYVVNANGTINTASETVFIDQLSDSVWHNGGGMFFHPDDGFLYFTNGDDASKDPQSISYGLHSGVFRIDVDRQGGTISHAPPRTPEPTGSVARNYFIPNNNPFVGQANVLEEFFCLGLRSPHRMTIDPVSKRIYIGDVGAGGREEISVIAPGQSGLNFQWSVIEGLNGNLTPPYLGIDTPPVFDYPHSGEGAIIGGYVYRGSEFPELVGKYIFGDNISNNIYYLDETATPVARVYLCTLPFGSGPNSGSNYTGLSSFGLDANDELYLCQLSSLGGRIYKLSRSGPPARQMPLTLSETGLFANLGTLEPASGLVGYEVNTPLWSDGAHKQRWFGIPSGQTIGYREEGEWTFPEGSVFVKHFDLPSDARDPGVLTRLETRVTVRDDQGFVYGGSYRWRGDHSDADLVINAETVEIPVTDAAGTVGSQPWFFPGRQDCLTCHTRASGGVLGLKTKQNHREHDFGGTTDNQLRAWNHVGYFNPALEESSLPNLTKLAAIGDSSATVEHRMRSYLDSNCSHCHRPGGVQSLWDGRIDRPLAEAGIVNGFVVNDLGVSGARIIVPDDLATSLMHRRLGTATETYKMPPVAKNRVDTAAVSLLEQWIAEVTPPPAMPLPSPWEHDDIGGVQLAGDAAYGGGIFTARGAGDDIWGAQDGFHFVYRSLNGDGTMIARILAQSDTDAWAKAGVMIRDGLAASAKHVMTVRTPGNGVAFQYREATGGVSSHQGGPSGQVPVWLRVDRRGDLFVSSSSTDGVIWTEIGRLTVKMGSRLQAGLCITSHNGGLISTASFDNVYFMPGVPYLFTAQPQSVLARVGGEASFIPALAGDPPQSFQWRRNGRPIPRETRARFTIPSVSVAQAGTYQLLAGGRLLSESAALSVVGDPVFHPNIPARGTAILSVPNGGPGITFQWSKGGVTLDSNSKISGSKTSRLVIKNFEAADAGEYTCTASAFGLSEELGPYALRLLNIPSVTTAAPPLAVVSGSFLWQLTSDEPATGFLVRGLPRGLRYDARTNRVTGVPVESGSFPITLTPRNAAGTGASITFTLEVEALPDGMAGAYSGLIDRHPGVNEDLGGAFTLWVSPSGSVSGRLHSGGSRHVLRGRLDAALGANPSFGITIPRRYLAPLVLSLTFDRVTRSITGTLHGGVPNSPVTGRHAVVHPAGTPRSSSNFALSLTTGAASDPDVPTGAGWMRVRRLVSGGTTTLTVAGRLADGSRLTFGGVLWDDGRTPWRGLLYRGRGSVQGLATLSSLSASVRQLEGTLSWMKLDPLGFDAAVSFSGSDAVP